MNNIYILRIKKTIDNNKLVISTIKLEGYGEWKNEVDYSDSFNSINGCAVFFSPDDNTYSIYNKELLNEQIPTYSIFKIINSLMRLSQNVVTSADSKLGYDGTIHLERRA